MENMDKLKRILIVSAIIIISLFIIRFYLNTTNRKIKQVLKNNDFIYSEKKYTKQTSLLSIDEYNNNYENGIDAYYEALDFYIKEYQLQKIIHDYSNGLKTNIFLTYEYKEDMLTFTFEVEYDKKYYTFDGYLTEYGQVECEAIDDDGELTLDEKNTICSSVSNIATDFQKQADDLFKNTKIKDKITKQ